MTNKATKYGIMIIAAVLLVTMAFAGAASAATIDIKDATEWQSNVSNGYFADLGSADIINLTGDIDFEGASMNVAISSWNESTSPQIEGNYHVISNFSIGESSLFGSYFGDRIANLTLSNFSVSGSSGVVGGLVRYLNPASCVFENVSVKFGNITAYGNNVGGLVGQASNVNLKNCTVESCVIASSDYGSVGGLVGYAGSSIVDICKVVNCSVSGGWSVGGLVGSATSASGSPFMNGSRITNCIVSGYYCHLGGLVGFANSATENGIAGCVVENCTIVSAGGSYKKDESDNVGGLVGLASSKNCVFNAGNVLKWSAINGYNESNVATVVGNDKGTKKDIDDNVSIVSNFWLNNHTSMQASPRIIIAKSADTSKQGPEASINFNNGQFGEPSVSTAKIVTRLTGYGVGGQYEAVAYVYEPAAENQLVNTSVVNGKVYATNAANPTVPITEATICYTTVHLIAVNSTVGYHFADWDVTNNKLNTKIVVDAEDNFTMPDAEVNIGAIFAVNKTNVTANSGIATFGGDNYTALKNPSNGIVAKVLLENVSNVTNTAVNFTADNTSVSIPSVSGYNKEDIAIFDINATADGTAQINLTVTFADETAATANKDKIRFFHYAASGWEPLTISATVQNGADVLYTVETTSFSPFGIGIYTAIPQQYTPSSSSKQTGSTIILQEGQVAPNQVPTTTPTVAPTVKPTEKPATPTVIATAKPTTQATQQSPAPFVGLLAGLGAAAVLLRLRK